MANRGSVLWGGCAAAFLACPGLAGEKEGTCVIFFDKQEFESFNAADGKTLKGIEDFEESNVPFGDSAVLPARFQGNVPNVDLDGLGFPSGLTEKNIIIQDNVFPGPSPPSPQPSGSNFALFVIGAGLGDANSDKVGEASFGLNQPASLDLIFTEPNHTGVGFELSRFGGFPRATGLCPGHQVRHAAGGDGH